MGKPVVEEALSRAGRYQQVHLNVEVKEIIVGDGEAHQRFILVRNPQEEARDRATREQILSQIEQEFKGPNRLGKHHHPKVVCRLMAHSTYGRYLNLDQRGRPQTDWAKINMEAPSGQITVAYLRRHPRSGGRGLGLQAASGGGGIVPHPQAHAGTAARLPPPVAPHSRPHPALLACLAAHSSYRGAGGGKTQSAPHRATASGRTRPDASGGFRGPCLHHVAEDGDGAFPASNAFCHGREGAASVL